MIRIVDLTWPIRGRAEIALDHSYLLFSGLSSIVPEIHGNDRIGILPIRGSRIAPGKLKLTENSAIVIRTPVDFLTRLIAISGKLIRLGRDSVRVGVPTVQALRPAARLFSRLITIKGFQDLDGFQDAASRQIRQLGIASAHLDVGQRRVLRVKHAVIVGFSVVVSTLTDNDSLRLQSVGIGGRRRLGCGLFLPTQSVHS